MLASVEILDAPLQPATGPASPVGSGGRDTCSVKIDKNYSYAVFVSYCEVYNEKVGCLVPSSFLDSTEGGADLLL